MFHIQLCDNTVNLSRLKWWYMYGTTTEACEAPAENLRPIHRSIEAINRQRRQFSAMKTAHLSAYLERERTLVASPRLVVLNGWSDRCQPSSADQIPHNSSTIYSKKTMSRSCDAGATGCNSVVSASLSIRAAGLERFHAAGLHIWDIDHVIVTDGRGAAYSDLERIWTFNKEINSLLKEWQLEPHVISYWLHATAFEQNAHIIRPLFRQEKAAVHRLGTFHDISAFETVEINDHLAFDYSSTSPTTYAPSPLMVRFRPVLAQTQPTPRPIQESIAHMARARWMRRNSKIPASNSFGYTLGFLSQAPWAEAQNAFFSGCQTLILGIGETTFEEITSQSRPTASLGTTGIINILDNPATRLAIISEQGLSEGDIRIESLKYLREEAKGTFYDHFAIGRGDDN